MDDQLPDWLKAIFGPVQTAADPSKAGPAAQGGIQQLLQLFKNAPGQMSQNAQSSPLEAALQSLMAKISGQQHQPGPTTPPMFPPKPGP